MTGCASMSRFAITLKLLLLSALTLLLTPGCTNSRTDSGILVIAIEGLKSEDVACIPGEETDLRGFNFLCQNFLSIQGVVANSTSSAANLASLLSGLPPEKHGLRVNDQSIAATQVLLSEKLAMRGWRTSLFSGGAPILRRTQLNQGFETFDESMPLAPKIPYRSFELSSLPFFSWIKESEGSRHLTLITINDLLFPEIPTLSDKGETRPRSLEGQIDELDESLFHFFEDLQKRGLLKKWWVVVVGLSGRSDVNDRTAAALQVNPSSLLVPIYLHGPEASYLNESHLTGVWSFTQIGEFLQDIANDIDTGTSSRGSSFIEKLKDREANFASSEGCVSKTDKSLYCRTAFFDKQAWLVWEAPLRLDVPGRKELFAKIQASGERHRPEPLQIPAHLPAKFEALQACLEKFGEETPATAFVRACPSKIIQSLRNFYLLRQTLLARPESLRDQKLRFFHEWSQMAAAHQLYLKFDPTRHFNELDALASNEYLTIQKILERPELRDLQREAQRSLPPGIETL